MTLRAVMRIVLALPLGGDFINLKHQLQLSEQRIQRLAWIDYVRLAKIPDVWRAISRSVGKNIAKASSGLQRRGAKSERQVIN